MTMRSPLRLRRSALAASVLLLAGACRSGGAPSSALTSIAASPATATLAVGKTETLTVTGTQADGTTVAVTGATFQSSAPATATVSDAGLVTAVGVGTATLTVSAGSLTTTATVTVSQTASAGPLAVFDDNYGKGVTFNPFGGSTNPPTIDTTVHHTGTASLKIAVPATGYTGGAFAAPAQDLSGYNAVTFWAMASAAKTVDKIGLGNDSSSTTLQAELLVVPVTTAWTQFVIPLPLPARLTAGTGLFHYAVGSTQGAFTLWIDDIQYEKLPASVLGAPAPALASQTVNKGVGDTFPVDGLSLGFPVNGAAVAVVAAPAYFTFSSSNPAVATVGASGLVTAVGVGTTAITASLGTVAATGTLTVNVGSLNTPGAPPPTPGAAAATVISLLSDAYPNVPVDTFATSWSSGAVADVTIGGAHLKKYTSLVFAGIEFSTHVIDATATTHLHLDFWTPDSTGFKVKLVDFGADGLYGGTGANADSEFELAFDASTTPRVEHGKWISLDLPLSRFTGLASRSHLAQLILSASNATVFVGNVYFYKYVAPTSLPVFTDDYGPNVSFAPFGGSTNAVSVDTAQHHTGAASLKVVIPATGYTGGALVGAGAVDLSPFDALTFWAMASASKTIDKVGIANDAGPSVPFAAELSAVALTTTWTKFIVPLPLASKLTSIAGLFHFATGADAAGITIWFDDIQYERVGAAVLGAPHASFTSATLSKAAGDKFAIGGTSVAWFLNGSGTATALAVGASYFAFAATDPTVATISSAGVVTAAGAGHTHITATLDGVAAAGDITLDVTGVAPTPPPLPVFADDYAQGVSFAPFGGSTNAVAVDATQDRSGTGKGSLKVGLPAAGYTGGALVGSAPVDVSSYDAITFWAKASVARSFDKVGFANDTASTTYATEIGPLQLTTTWTQYVLPLPNPGNLTSLAGLFHFATGPDANGASVSFDDIQYEKLGAAVLGTPSAAIATETVHLAVGVTGTIHGATASYPISGRATAPFLLLPDNSFTFTSSDPTVASVDASGKITALKNGTADITAKLGSVAASGKTTVAVP